MKRLISALLCFLLLAGGMPMAQAADLQTTTLSKGVLGTLGSSAVSYQARLSVPGYLGQLEVPLVLDGEEVDASVSVVCLEGKADATVNIELNRFGGHIYDAKLYPLEYTYKQGVGFESAEGRGLSGKSDARGGSLDLGNRGGLYSGRIHFYYSIEDMGYRNIDAVPDEKWVDLFWFNLGVDYVLVLTENDVAEFLDKGVLDGFDWPGLHEMLGGMGTDTLYTEGSFDNFVDVNAYDDEVFSDISTQWYAPYVGRTYTVNLMKGNQNDTFYAEGEVTVAEAITIAARLHNIYYGRSGVFTQGSPWHQVYVDYAIARGMIESDTFDDYERPITRKEMALLLSKAVELTDLPVINTVAGIPDVELDDEAYAAICALYESGVLTGSEADGRFLPEDNIIRAEAATMIARLVTPELRVVIEE